METGREVAISYTISKDVAETARLAETIERLLEPYEEQLQQAESMPGWARRAARTPSPKPART